METDLTLRDYVELLRRRLWLVIAVFIAVLTAALVWSALQTPLYRSTARVLINQASAAEIFESQTTQNTSFADRVAANEVALIESQLVRDVVESRLGFEADISASVQSRADVISISAVDPDPVVARTIAQSYAEAYLDVRREEYIGERVAVSAQLLAEIAEIDDQLADANSADQARLQRLRDDLANQYDQLNISVDISPRASRIIDEANLPTAAFSPQVVRNLVLGALAGSLLGVGVAVLVESLDHSVRNREMIESITPGVPSLVIIPELKSEGDLVTLSNPGGVESEVFGTLRAALDFASVDDSIQIVQVTSAGPSAGKTTVAANLAVAMAQAGQSVALVDGDLRRPRLHSMFGLDQAPGLTTVILGRDTLTSAARELRLDNGRLRVYPSGPIPPGPGELLGSKRADTVFGALRRNFDVIIIDSPPVLPVADALIISRAADATLLVANAKVTRREDLHRSYESLVSAGANVVGTVLNRASGSSLEGYGYGYGYGGAESRNPITNIWRRASPSYAPRRSGTQVLDRSELPKFESARPTRRDAKTNGPIDTPAWTTPGSAEDSSAEPSGSAGARAAAASRRAAPGGQPRVQTSRAKAASRVAGAPSSPTTRSLGAASPSSPGSSQPVAATLPPSPPSPPSPAASPTGPTTASAPEPVESTTGWGDDVTVS